MRAYLAALAAVEPEAAVATALRSQTEDVYGRTPESVSLVAIGKAAPAMARGAAAVLPVGRGIVVSDHREACPFPVFVADHPVPLSHSVEAGRRVVQFVAELPSDEAVLFLISGGGSALVEVPVEGVTEDELSAAYHVLLGSGLAIAESNEIRAAMSQIKGGRLAALASGPSASLLISDIAVGGPESIASGPTIGIDLGGSALAIAERRGLTDAMPASVVSAIAAHEPLGGTAHPHIVVASPQIAGRAAAESLSQSGFSAGFADHPLTGDVGTAVASVLDQRSPGTTIVYAGETTVSLPRNPGSGGRNQHAALLAAQRLSGSGDLFAGLGTDGVDGASTAAGAIVDGKTADLIVAAGVDLAASVEGFDSATALEAAEATVVTGPTGTNVADIWMLSAGS